MARGLVAELVMGRVGYGPSLSWAEFVNGRDVHVQSAKYLGITITDDLDWGRDGVMVMCNGNALQCITIFKVMGSNV